MATEDSNPVAGMSLLDLGLEELTSTDDGPGDGQDQWAAAGRALVDRVDASLRAQRAAQRGAQQETQRDSDSTRPLSENYDCQFEPDGQPRTDNPEHGPRT